MRPLYSLRLIRQACLVRHANATTKKERRYATFITNEAESTLASGLTRKLPRTKDRLTLYLYPLCQRLADGLYNDSVLSSLVLNRGDLPCIDIVW